MGGGGQNKYKINVQMALTVVDANLVLDGLVSPLLGRESVKVDRESRFALQCKGWTQESLEKYVFIVTIHDNPLAKEEFINFWTYGIPK